MPRFAKRGKVDNSDDGPTIGIAIGLGVGIPVLLTVVIMSWLWVRHNKKLKEEDAEHDSVDFNGDVSFGIKEYPSQHWDEDKSRVQAANRSVASFGSSTAPTPKIRQYPYPKAHQSPHPQLSTFEDGSSSYLYTPHLVQGDESDYSRTLNSVYGPSPNYPSTDKLRQASGGFAHRVNSLSSMAISTSGTFGRAPSLTGPSTGTLTVPGTPVRAFQGSSMPASPSPFDTPKSERDRNAGFDNLSVARGEHPYRQYAQDQNQGQGQPNKRDPVAPSSLPSVAPSQSPEPASDPVNAQDHGRQESEIFFDFTESPPASQNA